MYKTARIAAVLALASFLAAVPARALSVKDWEAKSDRDQIEYLGSCFARLIYTVGKTDQPLSQKIKSYYIDKAPGFKYPAGFLDVVQQIVRMEEQAKTDRRVDLSKIEVEDIVLRNTAEKFKLPAAVASAGKSAGAVTPAPVKPDFKEAATPRPAPKPAPEPVGFGDLTGPGGIIKPPVFQISAFVTDWLGEIMTIEGTVSRVTVDRDYLSIYFRESPDGSFTGYSPDPDMFRSRYGNDFAGLIGKTVQIEGEILQFRGSKGSVRIADLKQIKLP